MSPAPGGTPPTIERLAEVLLEKFRSGGYAPGDKLPTPDEMVLTGPPGVSKYRTIQALKRLERLGITEAQQGSGWFLRSADAPVRTDTVASLAGEVASLREQVTEIAGQSSSVGEGGVAARVAEVEDRVGWLEDVLKDLYAKLSLDYPRGGANGRNRQAGKATRAQAAS